MTPTKKSCHGNTQNYTEEKYLNRIISVFFRVLPWPIGCFIDDILMKQMPFNSYWIQQGKPGMYGTGI